MNTKLSILFFATIASLSSLSFIMERSDTFETAPARTLYNFQDVKEQRSWFPLHDNVMGGVSTGTFKFTKNHTLIFSGKVSLENHGGFASIRSKTDVMNLEGVKKFKLRIKGDGKFYHFNISSSNFIADPGFQAQFKTKKDTWQEVTLNLEDFSPAFGSTYSKDHLKMSEIKLMGVVISDKQAGKFKIEVDWIKAY